MKILAHTCFIGITGYANHARSFFTALSKYHEVKVRNLTIGKDWKGYNLNPHDDEPYLTDEMKSILHQQTLYNTDGSRTDYPIYSYDANFKPDVHIVLMEMDHHYYYDNYDGYKIAFCVWESTRFPEHFFNRLMTFDEIWVPTKWQFDCLVEQGCPSDKIFIVPEGVDVDTFKPLEKYVKKEKFRFLHFGRWEYRKGTTEILKAFSEEFADDENVELIASVENPYPFDGLNSTEERVKYHNIDTKRIKFVNFPPREEYVKYLQEGDVFLSCSRSEGWNLPLIEAMACGTPSIYSEWGGQLQFAEGNGLPVKIKGLVPANHDHKDWPGEYCEPDWNDLKFKMRQAYEYYEAIWIRTFMAEYKDIHEDFNWDNIGKIASNRINKIFNNFAFVTTGNAGYMPVIQKLVESLLEFSDRKIIVYGINCDVPFSYPNVIQRRIDVIQHSEHDKWYWKQQACITSIDEDFDNFVWIDGDVVVNHNIDDIRKYFPMITDYPVPDVHVQEEFFGVYGEGKSQLFGDELAKELDVKKFNPYAHICMYVYNKKCKWWFERILKLYHETPLEDYKRLFLWNDEGIDNGLRWVNNFRKFLPLSNFDTSSYDGDLGYTSQNLHQFYKFWNEDGPQNFGKIYGYQFIPKDKSQILYFHGNKDTKISDKMISFIKLMRDKSFHQSKYFYTDVYDVKNLGSIDNYVGTTMDVARMVGWDFAIYHEIYNLQEYYHNRIRRINEGDIVVDLGGNIGIFNRWAYSQGASKVISFEPDKRYFKLLSLNADPKSILFNAAISDKIGEIELYESPHLGGSATHQFSDYLNKYKVRTYTLDYLFETGLIDRIDFLKIDIEGAEIEALNGISDENLKKVKNISME